MNRPTNLTKSPKCGGTELGVGKHSGYGVMIPKNKMWSFGSEIEYILCTDCGFIIEGYVKHPEKFKGTSNA
ncbi:transcription initiation factor TFIIIB [Halobacillus mangrovi]|uniref:Transcription initiation factor TFIIIB n=1 Tax=Halobacillus mangrovi TaxID=402384 RepID=A0A1W5ZYG0_9BACI|nr:transcription initiation factor TFIIIB [Halobacillus mangrovi]ARI78267.1 transcription initiation factor TFIIIB [Halobacillus mangrovi]